MCVHMCGMLFCVKVHVCAHVYIMHVYVCACMCTYVYACMYMCAYMYKSVLYVCVVCLGNLVAWCLSMNLEEENFV